MSSISFDVLVERPKFNKGLLMDYCCPSATLSCTTALLGMKLRDCKSVLCCE